MDRFLFFKKKRPFFNWKSKLAKKKCLIKTAPCGTFKYHRKKIKKIIQRQITIDNLKNYVKFLVWTILNSECPNACFHCWYVFQTRLLKVLESEILTIQHFCPSAAEQQVKNKNTFFIKLNIFIFSNIRST